MAKFLLSVWPLQTHIDPFMAVALGLRRRGHEVAFYVGASEADAIIREGFQCFPFQAVDEAVVATLVRGVTSNSWRPGRWRDFLLSTVPGQVADLQSICSSWQPEVILCDMAMWGPILIIKDLKKLPVAVLSHVAACVLPGAENPLPGMKWLTERNWTQACLPLVAAVIRAASSSIPRAANRLRKVHRLLPLPGTVTEFTATLPLYLVPGMAAFDGDRQDLPATVHYVGPCIWDKNQEDVPPAWVSELSRDRPIVLVAEGGIYPDDPLLLRTASRGLANQPMQVVLIAGRGRNPKDLKLGPLAPNVRLESWTPLSNLLPVSDVVVANGDTETVMAALHRHLPMVLVPAILDQPEIAWRVEKNGAGLRLPPRRCTPERLRAAVERVLSEKQFRENAARLGADHPENAAGDRAAELLEALASGA